jgi:hypothetical protein
LNLARLIHPLLRMRRRKGFTRVSVPCALECLSPALSLPVAEKLRMVENLRKRALAIAASRRKRMRSNSSRIRFSPRFRNPGALLRRGAR